MEKSEILDEIKRTAAANGGVPLGWRRFEEETGVKYYDWYGRHWTRWNDAVQEAGLSPNKMSEAYSKESLISADQVDSGTRSGPHSGGPVDGVAAECDVPVGKVFRRMGNKAARAALVVNYCESREELESIQGLWAKQIQSVPSIAPSGKQNSVPTGYVYLVRHGSRREYKIGRTNKPLRREGEIGIQLPEILSPVHYIATDDPSGVENYWHTRFAEKRKEGEWFSLTSEDVKAFKRWRRIF